MPGIKAWRTRSGSPLVQKWFVEASSDLYWGDVMIIDAATLTNRLQLATNTELQSTTGILGFMWEDLKLDSSGQLVQQVPSTVETGAAVIHPVPSFSRLMHRGSQALSGSGVDIGNYQAQVCVFTDDLEILIDVCTNSSATTVDQTLVGKKYGMIKDAGDGRFKLDVNNTTQVSCIVTEVDTTQPKFNQSSDINNAVWVRIAPAYQQYNNGGIY